MLAVTQDDLAVHHRGRDAAAALDEPARAAGGRIVGCLALSSATKNAFGEASLNTLRLVEQPAAIVINNARLASVHGATTA